MSLLRDAVALCALALGMLLVVFGGTLPRLSFDQPATVARMLPHGALLTFPDGAFTVVPRSVLGPLAREGAVVQAAPAGGAWPAERTW